MQIMTEKKIVPKLRFGEFKDDWNNHLLDDIANFLKGKGISKSELDDDGKTECIRYGELYGYYNELIDEVKSKTNLENLVLSKANDVIIPASGETQLDIATASCVLRSGIALGGDLNVIRTENNGLFLSYYLNSKKKFEIARLSQGSSVVHLYASQLKTLNLNLPSISEQQKIASFLSAVDEKLQHLTKKKDLLEEYKKGVMQKIFSQELRFKDANGNNYPDWEEKKLGDCIVNNKKSQIQVNEVSENDRNKINQFPFFTSGERLFYSKEYLIKDENIFMSTGGKATVKYYNGLCSYSTDTFSFTTNKECSVGFIFFFLKNIIKKIESQYFYGSGLKHLDKKGIVKYKLSVPTLNEQKKIANFLSSIDKKIELVSTQIENTKAFKKGLLQQMFV